MKLGKLLQEILNKYICIRENCHLFTKLEKKNKTEFFLLFKNLKVYNYKFFDKVLKHPFFLGLNKNLELNQQKLEKKYGTEIY